MKHPLLEGGNPFQKEGAKRKRTRSEISVQKVLSQEKRRVVRRPLLLVDRRKADSDDAFKVAKELKVIEPIRGKVKEAFFHAHPF